MKSAIALVSFFLCTSAFADVKGYEAAAKKFFLASKEVAAAKATACTGAPQSEDEPMAYLTNTSDDTDGGSVLVVQRLSCQGFGQYYTKVVAVVGLQEYLGTTPPTYYQISLDVVRL